MVEPSLLEGMGASMSHRGDGAYTWASGAVGLCGRGSGTLCPPERPLPGSPPQDPQLRVTFDGRIDNAGELRSALGVATVRASAEPDAALVLEAYRRWGHACPDHLRGDFAFALWDEARRELFCARDCFGARPLYYCDARGRFALASEMRAFRRLPEPPRVINEGRIADYLVGDLEGIDKVSTPFTDIHRLPPGHSMTVGREGTSIRRYWAPDPTVEIRRADPAEYAEELRCLLSQAVERCLRGDGVSVMLSGGLDSSSIAALAGRLHDRLGLAPVDAVSAVIPDDPDCIESRCVRIASGLPGIHPHHVEPAALGGFVASLDRLLYDADDYHDSWSMHVPLAVYARAQQLGLRVMLDGVDGDIVTSLGQGYLTCLARSGRWGTTVREARGLADFMEEPSWRLCYRAARAVLATTLVGRLWRRSRGPKPEVSGGSIINPGFAERVAVTERLATMRETMTPRSGTTAGMHAAALDAPFVTVALERYDRLASAHSIEARHPLFDRDLVEFCLAMPWHQKRREGCRKWGLRSAMRDLMSHGLCWRTDYEHLGPRFYRAWFELKDEEMRDFVSGHLDEIEDYVSVPLVRAAYDRFREGQEADDGFKVWQAFSLWHWVRRNA